MKLVVSEVFGPTVQGEGPSLGRRAAFVRLGRCDLDCRWCDSKFTWDWNEYDPAVELSDREVDDIVDQIAAMDVDRVVVTGGEPMIQQRSLVALLAAGAARGWTFEIETNGRHAPTDEVVDLIDQFNVSPKLANSGVARDKAIVPAALAALAATGKAAFKFVATSVADLDEVQAIVDEHDLTNIWIMPEGTTAAAVSDGGARLADAVTKRGWNLTTRLHVLLWGDERGR